MLSNAWLKDEGLIRFVYDRTIKTFNKMVETGKVPIYCAFFSQDQVKRTINGEAVESDSWMRAALNFQGDSEVYNAI